MLDLKEKLSEALENAKERFTNPMFYSFIISWCAVNWKIAFGIIWYDSRQIEGLGYKTVFDFIIEYTYSPFWLPFWFAILYTFVVAPVIRNLNNVWTAFLNGIGNAFAFKATKKAPISVEMYKQAQDSIEQVHNQYADIINRAAEKDKILTEAQTNLTDANRRLSESQAGVATANGVIAGQQIAIENMESELGNLKEKAAKDETSKKQINDLSIFSGAWDAVNIETKIITTFIFDLDTAQVKITSKDGFTLGGDAYKMIVFMYNPFMRQVAMMMVTSDKKSSIHLNVTFRPTYKGELHFGDGFLDAEAITFARQPSKVQ
jgi:hypothetical protein